MKIFISHSSVDKPKAKKITDKLREDGFDVWVDTISLKPGDSIVDKIEQGIIDSNILIILLSNSSNNSSWVKTEINAFFNLSMANRNIRIIPVLIEKTEIPALLRDRLYIDLTSNFESGLIDLLESFNDLRNTKYQITLPDEVLIDNFNSGMVTLNRLGGSTLTFHENGDPLSIQALFLNRNNGKSLGLSFDFSTKNELPPQFIGYATRLQFADWREFVLNGYGLCFDCCSDGNTSNITLEIKRLKNTPKEHTREEIVKWNIDLSTDWKTVFLKLSDISFPNKSWDNMWEICFVLKRDSVLGEKGIIMIDNLKLTKNFANRIDG